MGNLVAIVGRPNVGKSTLFNRLTKTRQAIVNEQAGTTRDRQYGKSEWLGREFSVVHPFFTLYFLHFNRQMQYATSRNGKFHVTACYFYLVEALRTNYVRIVEGVVRIHLVG